MDKEFQKEVYEERKGSHFRESREVLLEKLIMNELLNSKDFNNLLKLTQEEFQKTFYPTSKINLKEEKEIE